MGTSFDTVWSPTIIVFLLIMRLFLEAGGIFSCVFFLMLASPSSWWPSLASCSSPCPGWPYPGWLSHPHPLESPESLSFTHAPCCCDLLSYLLYSQAFVPPGTPWPLLVPFPLPGDLPCLSLPCLL